MDTTFLRQTIVWICFAVFCCCGQSGGGDIIPDVSATSGTTSGTAASGSPMKPPLYVKPATIPIQVQMKDGEMVYLPMNLPEIERLLSGKPQNKSDKPLFSLQDIFAEGVVESSLARIELQMRIHTFTADTVAVPLGLQEGVFFFQDDEPSRLSAVPSILTPIVSYQGPGVFAIDRHPNGGYVAIIKGTVPEMDTSAEYTIPSAILPANMGGTATETNAEPPTTFTHQIKMVMYFPIESVGDAKKQLRVSFPNAVRSRFQLSIPKPDVTLGETKGCSLYGESPFAGSTLQPSPPSSSLFPSSSSPSPSSVLLPNRMSAETGNIFLFHNLASIFETSWKKNTQTPVSETPVFSVENARILVQLNPTETVFDAVIPVICTSGELRQFLVRLPEGSRYVPANSRTSEYTIRELLSPELPAGVSLKSPFVEVTLTTPLQPVSQPTMGSMVLSPPSVSVTLKAVKQLADGDEDIGWRDIEGFEVLDTDKQYGSVDMICSDMRPNLKRVRRVKQLDLTEEDVSDGIDSRFEYFSQPFLLQAQVAPPQSRVNVKMEHLLQIEKGQTFLVSKLSYVVYGTKVDQIRVDMSGWPRFDVGPPNVVDVGRITLNEQTGILTIPLLIPSDGPIELELKGFAETVPPENGVFPVEFRLPQPVGSHWVEPPLVTVVPADNIELELRENVATDSATPAILAVPNIPSLPTTLPEPSVPSIPMTEPEPEPVAARPPNLMSGLSRLSRKTVQSRMEIPIRQQEPLFFRMDSATALFAADAEVRTQIITATSLAEVRLLDAEEQVSQTLSFTIQYEPTRRLSLFVPITVDESGKLRITLDGRLLDIRTATLAENEVVPPRMVKKWVMLPDERIGSVSLILRYSMEPFVLRPKMTMTTTVPLVVPADVVFKDQKVNVSVGNGVDISLRADLKFSWKMIDRGTMYLGRTAATPFAAGVPGETAIPLYVVLVDQGVLGTTEVERAWVQTWMLGEVREDRVAYRFTSNRDSIRLHLPENVLTGRLSVMMDDQPVTVFLDKTTLLIPLTPEMRKRPHTLDVWYQVRPPQTDSNWLSIELPKWDDEVWVRSMYWQMILPTNRHIVGGSNGWTPEYHWAWNGLYWARQPTMTQKDIGVWVGSKQAQALTLPEETSRYLFSSLEPPAFAHIYVVDRLYIVLLGSGTALVIGLGLLYFPKFRSAGVFLSLGILLLGSLLYRPTIILVVLQSAVFGVAISLIAMVLYRVFIWNDTWSGTSSDFSVHQSFHSQDDESDVASSVMRVTSQQRTNDVVERNSGFPV